MLQGTTPDQGLLSPKTIVDTSIHPCCETGSKRATIPRLKKSLLAIYPVVTYDILVRVRQNAWWAPSFFSPYHRDNKQRPEALSGTSNFKD